MSGERDSLAQEIGKKEPFKMPEQEAFLNLLRTADALAGEFAILFKQHGITDAQYNVLRILRGHGTRVATRKIADEMVTRQPDITRLIDRMEKHGLVSRERCKDDRRVVFVSISPKARKLLAALDESVLDLHRAQLGHLGPAKLKQLNRLLFDARGRNGDTAKASDDVGGAT